jgi:hypothetical protein
MVMEYDIATLIVALVCVAIAWKVLKGIVKTVVLVVILLAAAGFVFGTGGFGL